MDPISIIGGGVCFGLVFLGILYAIPKLREYNEQLAREEAAIQALVQTQGWRMTKLEKGDIKWVIHTPTWQLAYDSDSSSESSTPHLQWIAPTPRDAKARFVVLTEHGLKMMKHPFTRKAFGKLQGFAEKLGQSKFKTISGQSNAPAQPNRPDPAEVFQVLDAQNEYTIAQTKKQKYMLATSSHDSLNRIKSSEIPYLLSQIMDHEKTMASDNSERLAQFSTRIEIKTYTNRPNVELIKAIITLGEYVLNQKL